MPSKSQYAWKKVMTAKEVIKLLEQNGWIFVRQKGSHKQFKKNEIICTVPFPGEIKTGTLASIKRTVALAEI